MDSQLHNLVATLDEIVLATNGGQVQGGVFDEDEHAVAGATVLLGRFQGNAAALIFSRL